MASLSQYPQIVATQLVQFLSTDGLLLPGMLFAAPSTSRQAKRKVAINLHGNGSSSVFYSFDRAVEFAKPLNKAGISFFTFNNRGAHYLKKLTQLSPSAVSNSEGENAEESETEVKLGTAYEQIADCQYDIEGAIAALEKLGYNEFYLLGHSTGANKIAVYNFYQPKNRLAKYVLLGGGDDTGLLLQSAGSVEHFQRYLKQAKAKIDQGKGQDFIPKYMSGMLLSYQSYFDTANPDGDYNVFPFYEYIHQLKLSTKPLFRFYQAIRKPTLVLYGENDIFCAGPAAEALAILEDKTPHPEFFSFDLIADADHGFKGHEAQVGEKIAVWLAGE